MPSRQLPRPSLAALIACLVFGTALVLVIAFLLVMKRESDATALESARMHFGEIADKTTAKIDIVLTSISTLANTAALAFPGDQAPASPDGLADARLSLKALLDANGQLLSAYVGYANGAFHQLIAPRGNRAILTTYQAPAATAYIDRIITVAGDGARRQSWRFLDKELGILASRADAQVAYDPRSRPWYAKAREVGHSVFTAPYVFSSSRLPGVTCSRALSSGHGVFGVDVTLTRLGDILAAQTVTQNGTLWIVDRDNRLVAFPGQTWEGMAGEAVHLLPAAEAARPLVRAVARAAGAPGADYGGKPRFFQVDGVPYLAMARTMPAEQGLGLTTIVAAPVGDITGSIERMAARILVMASGLLVLLLPLAIALARRASRSVGQLAREAEKITRFDFSPSPVVASGIREVEQLARACEVMKTTIQTKTECLVRTTEKLSMLVQGGLSLAAEKDIARLVTLIFDAAKDLTQADGGVLYLLEGEELSVELLSLGSGSVMLGGLSGHPAPRVRVLPGIMAFLSADSVLRFACQAFVSRQNVTATAENLTLFPTGLPEEPRDYAIRSLIAVPLVTRRDEVLGVIQLFNPVPEDGQDGGGEGGAAAFIGSLAAQAAVTLDNRNLVQSLRAVFDALIQVIAASIDAKSPYTAGHCSRVPALTEMLAREAHVAENGPLRDFRLDTDDDWRQLWIAAWLHDCGKVTTPEYVVDKATKLETIYNRIHEVRMRFEVLRRDAELRYHRRLLAGEADEAVLRREFERECRELEDDFAFVAQCNTGGEFLSDEARARLARIAGRTWLRHFNDRLGLSEDELRSRGQAPAPPLPALEAVLADKPEHLVSRSKDYSLLKDAHGQPIEVPAYEYNRGELYNLGIVRGTLTEEERFKINEHTLSGLEMLKKVPFPDGLRRVPEIALAHHEKLNGTGYPLKKSGGELSMEARILAIADIFEALTASDRPYKQAKTVAEAVRIMSFMRNDAHIDADLFDIFLEKAVYRQYAEKFLQPWQLDEVDLAKFCGKRKAS